MYKFCIIDDKYILCDDETIKVNNLKVAKEVSEEEFAKYEGDYYTDEAGELVLGASPAKLNQAECDSLKRKLADMDYKTSKYADGEYTEEEWQAIVAERQAIRARIRELEELLAN